MWSMCVKGLDVRPKVADAAKLRVASCSHQPVVRRRRIRWRGVDLNTEGIKTDGHRGSAWWRRLCSAASKAVTTQDHRIFVRRIHCFGEGGDFEFNELAAKSIEKASQIATRLRRQELSRDGHCLHGAARPLCSARNWRLGSGLWRT